MACQGASSAPSSAQSAAAASPMQATTDALAGSRQNAITAAVARVAPSVVTVQTEVIERVPADVFEQFFGGRSSARATAGLGSGFIVRSDGGIVTKAHLGVGDTRIQVDLPHVTSQPARLLSNHGTY